MENKIKHLEMIQNVISRMVNMSFMLKGWTVTLAVAVMALSSKGSDSIFFLIAYVPIFCFWFLDAYYLMEERLYRALYDKVRNTDDTEVDFSMTADNKTLGFVKQDYWKSLGSKTELAFYLPLSLVTTIVMLLVNSIVTG